MSLSLKLVNSFKALGSERRLSILRFLARGERTMLNIARHLRVTDSAASYHLRKLVREHCLVAERRGKETYFSVALNLKASKLFKQIIQNG